MSRAEARLIRRLLIVDRYDAPALAEACRGVETGVEWSVLLLGLLNGFNSRIEENPALPPGTKEQISAATETGIPIMTTEEAYKNLRDAGLKPAEAATVTDDYADAQLDALKVSMLAVALLAVLSLWFTRRLPGKPKEAA